MKSGVEMVMKTDIQSVDEVHAVAGGNPAAYIYCPPDQEGLLIYLKRIYSVPSSKDDWSF